MITVSYTALLHLLLPEVIVIVTALLVLAADLLISRTAPMRTRFTTGAVISAIGCIGAITQIAARSTASERLQWNPRH